MSLRYIGGKRIFGYRGSGRYTNPVPSKSDKNIKGLELEIDGLIHEYPYDSWDDPIEDEAYLSEDDPSYNAFVELIKTGTLLTQDTVHKAKKDYNAAITYDRSVSCEITLQANQQKNIMKKINDINKHLNNSCINNSEGTSCHIHNNMQYILNEGANLYEMQRASEFLAPILFRISGRNAEKYQRWCHTRLRADITQDNLMTFAENADQLRGADPDTHELICNGQHNYSAEMRIFSNRHNFNYNLIKVYIEFCDLLIQIATEMKGRSYVNHFDSLVEQVNEFCNKTVRRRKTLRPFGLQYYIVKEADLKYADFYQSWNKIYNLLDACDNMTHEPDKVKNVMRIILAFRNDYGYRIDIPMTYNTVNTKEVRRILNTTYIEELNNL